MLLAHRSPAIGAAKQCSRKPTVTTLRKQFSSRPASHIVRAAVDEDEALEKRLAKLRKTKPAAKAAPVASTDAPTPAIKEYDYTDEVVFFEGNPSRGDLAVNVALGTTLVWLPLTIAAVTRALYVTYKVTDKRIMVTTAAPWQNESTSIPYEEVKDVVAIGRGLGLWGDMVVTLRNGDKIEMRSVEKFQELREYILQRRDAVKPPEFDPMQDPPRLKRPGTKGFA